MLAPNPKKRKLSENQWQQKCVICFGEKGVTEKLTKAGEKGIEGIMKGAEKRKDRTYDFLTASSSLEDIGPIYYHRMKCYMAYASDENLQYVHNTTSSSLKDDIVPSLKRGNPSYWSDCLICGNKKFKGDTKLHLIQSEERADNLLEAAQAMGRENILLKIQGEDLIAKEGLYHNKCMAFIIKEFKYKTDVQKNRNDHDEAFEHLRTEIEPDLFKHGKAILLPTLLNRFKSLLTENDQEDVNYPGFRLKKKLCDYYGDRIIIQKLQSRGTPNFIISSAISLGDAIRAAQKLKKEMTLLKNQQNEDCNILNPPNFDDESFIQDTLRNATAILRHEMNKIAASDTYPSLSECTQKALEEYAPSLLKQFIIWLIDKDS